MENEAEAKAAIHAQGDAPLLPNPLLERIKGLTEDVRRVLAGNGAVAAGNGPTGMSPGGFHVSCEVGQTLRQLVDGFRQHAQPWPGEVLLVGVVFLQDGKAL